MTERSNARVLEDAIEAAGGEDAIFDRIASGELITNLADEFGVLRGVFYRWIAKDDDRREWHKRSGFSKRSLVENAIYRCKTIIGRRMRSRTFVDQQVEVQLACRVLNTMIGFGMPDSYRVE